MPRGVPTGGRDELSRLLVTLRGDHSQEAVRQAAAKWLNGRVMSQSKVYRAESGRFPLSPEEADAYARACHASAADRRKLVALTVAAQRDRSKPSLQRNPIASQERILRLEQTSKLIRSWQPDIIIGSLQTPAYTSAITGKTRPDWEDLRERRRTLLHQPGREWRLLMHEKALTWGLASAEVMAGQMAHLDEVSRLPHVRLGLVPSAPTIRLDPPPAGSFHLYDTREAIAATDAGTSFLTSSALLATYVSMFGQLERVAVFGDEARVILGRVRDQYRNLT